MAASVVLDTTILSHLARNEAAVTAAFGAWLDAGNGIVISRVTAYEFQRGVYAGSVSAQEQQAGELFLVNFAIRAAARLRGRSGRAGSAGEYLVERGRR